MNLSKTADRAAYRASVQGDLDAIDAGTWPRDAADALRYSQPNAEYVRPILVTELKYLDGIPARLAVGDPSLKGWEGWTAPSPEDPSVEAVANLSDAALLDAAREGVAVGTCDDD